MPAGYYAIRHIIVVYSCSLLVIIFTYNCVFMSRIFQTSISYRTCTEMTELWNCLNCNVSLHMHVRRHYETHVQI